MAISWGEGLVWQAQRHTESTHCPDPCPQPLGHRLAAAPREAGPAELQRHRLPPPPRPRAPAPPRRPRRRRRRPPPPVRLPPPHPTAGLLPLDRGLPGRSAVRQVPLFQQQNWGTTGRIFWNSDTVDFILRSCFLTPELQPTTADGVVGGTPLAWAVGCRRPGYYLSPRPTSGFASGGSTPASRSTLSSTPSGWHLAQRPCLLHGPWAHNFLPIQLLPSTTSQSPTSHNVPQSHKILWSPRRHCDPPGQDINSFIGPLLLKSVVSNSTIY